MRTIRTILPALLLFVAAAAQAQTTEAAGESDLRARTELGLDWKLAKGLHLEAGYEMRANDCCTRIERNQLNAGVRYSPVKPFEIGAGYCYIGRYDSEGTFKPRHRVYGDLTGSCKFGAWKLSLRERVQLTHNAYEFNAYQQTPNLLELKSRLKLTCKAFIHLEPYTYLEVRNCFNGPTFTAEWDEAKNKYRDYEFLGYEDAYINRVRGALGVKWNIDNNHGLDFRLMADKCHDKEIDTNAEGTKLKSFTESDSFNAILVFGYTYSF